MRARSFLSERYFFTPSICPIDIWKRSRNICSAESRNCFRELVRIERRVNLVLFHRITLAIVLVTHLRQSACSRTTNLVGIGSFAAASNIAFSARPGRPLPSRTEFFLDGSRTPTGFRCAFTFTHTRFSRLLGDRLIGEHADPNFTAALDDRVMAMRAASIWRS